MAGHDGIWQDDMDRAINRISPVPASWSRVIEPFTPLVSTLDQVDAHLTMIVVKCLSLEALDTISTNIDALGGDFRLNAEGMMEYRSIISDNQFAQIMFAACVGLIPHCASIEYAAAQHTPAIVSEMDRHYWVCSCGDRSEMGFPESYIADNEGLRHILLAAQEIRVNHGE